MATPTFTKKRWFPTFHVLANPVGALCNLDCTYCYYLEKEHLYPNEKARVMADETLEKFIQQYIVAQVGPTVQFLWQGGEPTLAGLEFFQKAIVLQQRFANGKKIENALQTNGTLLTDAFCEFLKQHDFLVGLSIDGPGDLHDGYRRFKGNTSSLAATLRGLELLKKHQVPFNILTVVHRENAKQPLAVYSYLKELGAEFIQFIPLVERVFDSPVAGLFQLMLPNDHRNGKVADWSVVPADYGNFLSTIFDYWVQHDVAKIYVQMFDIALEHWLGMEPALCIFRTTCGSAVAIEKNGDVYSCDHYVFPEYKLGNISQTTLVDLVESDAQRDFGNAKRDTLPKQCRECDVYFACKGECPKNRFLTTADGQPGLNYLCAGYMHFFRHIRPYMDFMANEVRNRRAPARVMEFARQTIRKIQ